MTDSPTNLDRFKNYKAALDGFKDAGWHFERPRFFENVLVGPAVYVCDVDTGKLILLTFEKGTLQQCAEASVQRRIPYQKVCDTFGSLLSSIIRGEVAIDKSTQDALAVGAAFYLVGTQAYKASLDAPLTPQYGVLRCLDASVNSHYLRPFVLVSEKPVPIVELEVMIGDVLQQDRRVHPERFPKGQVIEFKVRGP